MQPCTAYLVRTAANDARLALCGTVLGTTGFNCLDDAVRVSIAVGNLAKDDMLAIEPRGDNGGDEELGAVAMETVRKSRLDMMWKQLDTRIRTSVGHGQQERLAVLQLEVLVGKFLAVDGATTGALIELSTLCHVTVTLLIWQLSYIATSEVTTLKHELWDDSMELGANVALTLLLGFAKLLEVLGGLGDDIVEELEVDAARLCWMRYCQSLLLFKFRRRRWWIYEGL